MSKYLTREEAMAHLRVGNAKMWQLTKDNKVPFFQDGPGARMMFLESDLDRYMESIRVTAPAALAEVTSLSATYRKKRVKPA